jgi:hypothetical protein
MPDLSTCHFIFTLQIIETGETKIVDVMLNIDKGRSVDEQVAEYARRNLPGMTVVRYKWTEF